MLDMGELPAANGFVADPSEETLTFPLEVVSCTSCSHVQLRYTVSREHLFSEYMYFATDSGSIPDHFFSYGEMLERRYLDHGDLAVDIGSNDGGLLASLSDDVDCLGVEPAKNVAQVAEERGVTTITEFFNPATARAISDEYGPVTVLTANNVVAHIDDLHEFFESVDILLEEDGTLLVEVPYLIDLLSETQISTIYHEHLSYFSIASLSTLVEQYEMTITDIERLDRHGGSIRVHVQRNTVATPTLYVADLLSLEEAMGASDPEILDSFETRAQQKRRGFQNLVSNLHDAGHSIVGYGASAKGNVLLNYCDIGSEEIDYIVDSMPAKQGTYAPGTNIPVRSPEAFRSDPPDYALLLAWNYRDLIYEKESDFLDSGGRFIVPTPNLDVLR